MFPNRLIIVSLMTSLFSCAGCALDELTATGRPCDNTTACGAGTTCDLVLKKCVEASQRNDSRPADARYNYDSGIDSQGLSADLKTEPFPNFNTIAAGSFIMGSPNNEFCRQLNETQHQVTFTRSFEIMTTEITQKNFQTVMGYNPSAAQSCGENCPVEQVNWHEVVAYCNKLSTIKGYTQCYNCTGSGVEIKCEQSLSYQGKNIYSCPGYRLPTEAEWEYAYRAGTPTSLHNNYNLYYCESRDNYADAIGWYYSNSGNSPHPVANKQANNWGLYDMAGNVGEWVNDFFQVDLGNAAVTDPVNIAESQEREIRGGSCFYYSHLLRAAYRYGRTLPTYRNSDVGGRCVRSK